jgi:adenine-specific DNA-methyltransferase
MPQMADLFADFNGLPKGADKTDFYQHDQNWSNRMILGDSLQVMASLAEREGLRGKVQCIYFDPPYGIKFNSNFQWSTTSRDVKDGNAEHITREPEQVKAFRDTWRDGIHSYLTYLRDRLTVARDLLAESGSIFVQIGDENVHRVRAVMDEVFGEENLVSEIIVDKTSAQPTDYVSSTCDFVLMYAKSKVNLKYREVLRAKGADESIQREYRRYRDERGVTRVLDSEESVGWEKMSREVRLYRQDNIVSQRPPGDFPVQFQGREFRPITGYWKTGTVGMERLVRAGRIELRGKMLSYVRYFDDYPVARRSNYWGDTKFSSRSEEKLYVVQTSERVIERCILMATDPGDLVLDPTCGSGTTAMVAEQWGRRWITIDTSRVALALARARVMGARYPFYLLSDSRDGQIKESEITRTAQSSHPTHNSIRHGFVYERVPHIMLKSIANNAEIDIIWEKTQQVLGPLRHALNKALKKTWEEWEIPSDPDPGWSTGAKQLHSDWWAASIARQKEIDASIAAKAESEYLYDKPYEDKRKARVAGPFTVESLSPHRVLGVDENDELIDPAKAADSFGETPKLTFPQLILENLKTAGVQQAHKADKIDFTALAPWPGTYICAEGVYAEGKSDRRAAIFIGPEFGTVTRADLVAAAKEAGEGGFDVLIACAFSYEARTTDFDKLGHLRVLKARMNADLHMAEDLRNNGKGNLFVIFGEPDIDLIDCGGGKVKVKVNGVDVFHPNTGEVRSDGADGIACWFIDTDYNEESFFVRHAYFLGANDPYGSLKTTLRAEINC